MSVRSSVRPSVRPVPLVLDLVPKVQKWSRRKIWTVIQVIRSNSSPVAYVTYDTIGTAGDPAPRVHSSIKYINSTWSETHESGACHGDLASPMRYIGTIGTLITYLGISWFFLIWIFGFAMSLCWTIPHRWEQKSYDKRQIRGFQIE